MKKRESLPVRPEGSLALSRCAGTEERSGGVTITTDYSRGIFVLFDVNKFA